MCGVAGELCLDEHRPDVAAVERMAATMDPRGPDGAGLYVSDGVERQRSDRLPDGGPIVSSPLASILITGERDAVLVDMSNPRASARCPT